MQHALRAFTAKDRKAIKLTAENYPISPFYDTADVLTSLGIGEALVSALDEKGRPTPLAATMMRAPMSRMDILTDKEIKTLKPSIRISLCNSIFIKIMVSIEKWKSYIWRSCYCFYS